MALSFSDSNCASTVSIGHSSTLTRAASIQTLEISLISVASGENINPNLSTQTDMVMENVIHEVLTSKLVAATDRLAAAIIQEINFSQDAFRGYTTLRVLENHDISYKYKLTCQIVDRERLQCVGLSWNATGAMICAAFGRPDLCGWCDECGVLCCWSLFRGDFCPSVPSHTLEHATCFTALACHPSRPSLLAAGTFNGELLIYDLASPDDALKACSDINEYFHREPITALQWVRNSTSSGSNGDSHRLVSLSSDAKILWWSLTTIERIETGGRLPYPVRILPLLM